jgi:hypothetical protein
MSKSAYLFCNNPAHLVHQRMNTYKNECMSSVHIFIFSRNTYDSGVLFMETSVFSMMGT